MEGTLVETVTFVICAAIVLGGGVGVLVSRNPVHAALSMVACLFGIAVLFLALGAHLLAAVQVIVYTGAIVVLILFVMMLLGIDKTEDVGDEPLPTQRIMAALAGLSLLLILLVVLVRAEDGLTGQPSTSAATDPGDSNIAQVGRLLFTDHVFAFELTAVLLTIAVLGAVVMARRNRTLVPVGEAASLEPAPAEPDPGEAH